ncbi:aminotransferase class V-fold PLP-dependent enzyme [Saccharopolyspora montiporae]|uniref:aminotransferase class V-fold PLP-dependent enzyme n=1 Tax=Saccharopolyspora montiporae TaxID=2781240 RepID=UPI00351C532A
MATLDDEDLAGGELVAALRADTAGCANVVHFNNAGSALPPKPVVERVIRHLRSEEAVGGYEAAGAVAEELAAVHGDLAALVGADPAEIAVVDSATRAWLAVFTALPLSAGDRILTSVPEYSSNIIAMRSAAESRGVRVDVVPSAESGEICTDSLRAMLGEDVRVVAVTHAPTNGGLLQPLAEIGRIVADSPAVFLVDACQSVGQVPIDIAAVGADALAVTGRKYLRAPRGTGFLAVRRGLLEQLTPVHLDLHSATAEGSGFRLREDAKRFELWERDVAAVLGLAEAARYYRRVGIGPAHRRITALAEHLRGELDGIPGAEVTDLGTERSGIVAFRSDRVAAPDLQARLREAGINTTVSRAPSTPWDMQRRGLDEMVRASVHYYNTRAELDRLCEVVAAA